MLKEFYSTPPSDGVRRRWWIDDDLDLIVWLRSDASLLGFQLCYDKKVRERSLTWTSDSGYAHHRIDDGESSPEKNQSPILLEDDDRDGGNLRGRFLRHSDAVDPAVRRMVLDRL